MKRLLPLLLLGVALLPAQTPTPKPKPRPCTTTVPESIPHNAVEPAKTGDQEYFCPREEYTLEWYVVEDTITIWSSGSGVSMSYPTPRTVLVFKPMCVLREGQ